MCSLCGCNQSRPILALGPGRQAALATGLWFFPGEREAGESWDFTRELSLVNPLLAPANA